jgi:hypothetical protein
VRRSFRPAADEFPVGLVESTRVVYDLGGAECVEAHPVTATVLGEVRQTPPPSRLHSALAAWDIQVHSTFAIRMPRTWCASGVSRR